MGPIEYGAHRWEPWPEPAVRETTGPTRVVTDDPDPEFRPRRVGFAPPERPGDADPLLWEGDDG